MAVTFTAGHYEFLARFIRYELELARGDSWREGYNRVHTIEGMARLLASRLESLSKGPFDRARFLDACGVKDSSVRSSTSTA